MPSTTASARRRPRGSEQSPTPRPGLSDAQTRASLSANADPGRTTSERGNAVARALYTWRWSIVVLWFTAVILMILVRFWNYWSTLI